MVKYTYLLTYLPSLKMIDVSLLIDSNSQVRNNTIVLYWSIADINYLFISLFLRLIYT